jgi:hypothetical protein
MSKAKGVDFLKQRAKAVLAEGAEYKGTLTQFTSKYEIQYDIGKMVKEIPHTVRDSMTTRVCRFFTPARIRYVLIFVPHLISKHTTFRIGSRGKCWHTVSIVA